jgi:tetratricopeptide (TPR) repeat protein
VALSLAKIQNDSGDVKGALEVVEAIRKLPFPERDDPRIDLAEALLAASQSDYKRQLSLAQRAAEKAQASGSKLLLARAKLTQGWALDDLSQLRDSFEAYKAAYQVFFTAEDRDGTATALNDIGIVLQKQGDLTGARQKLEEAQAGFRHVGNENGLAGALTNLGEGEPCREIRSCVEVRL